MVSLLGGVPKIVTADQDAGFKITPRQLSSAITEKTKWLILNSPSNPTGAVYTNDELQALGAVLSKHPQVLILTDEIYEHLVYDGEFVSFAAANPTLYDRTLTMNGVSKAYAMTGWRIGYAGGPAPLIKAMAKVMTQSTSNPSSISQMASAAALTGDQRFLIERRDVFRERRDLVITGLKKIDGLKCVSPPGAFYVFSNIDGFLGRTSAAGTKLHSDIDLCMALLNEAHIAVVPGTAFKAPGHFRLSYATDETSLRQALSRLADFFAGLQ